MYWWGSDLSSTTRNPTHLHLIHRLRLADHAQVVLLPALDFVLALDPHGLGNPLTTRTTSLGSHGRNTRFRVCFGVGYLAVAIAVVGLFASSAFGQVVTVLPAVKALKDGDPHGLLVGLVF